MPRVSLKDVAQEANVSIVTASLVLNGTSSKSQARVSDKRRALILAAASKLGYRANAAGRLLKAKKINDIGLLFFEDSEKIREHVGFADLSIQFTHICRELGIRCQIDWFDSKRYPETIPDLMTNGLIGGLLIAGNPSGAAEEYLKNMTGMPFVRIEEPGGYSVMFNPDSAIKDAMEYLAATGHRRIGFVNGPENLQRYRHIREFITETAPELELEFPEELYYEADPYCNFQEDAVRAENTVMSGKEKPDALLVSSAVLAKSIISLTQKRGLRVPQDISVICFESSNWDAEKFVPPITSVEYDYMEIARDAVNMLKSLMDGKDIAEKHLFVNERFTIRNTVCSKAKTAE